MSLSRKLRSTGLSASSPVTSRVPATAAFPDNAGWKLIVCTAPISGGSGAPFCMIGSAVGIVNRYTPSTERPCAPSV